MPKPVYTLERGDGPMIVVAMFTVCTPYESEAGKLISSLIDHRQPFYIEALPKQKDWDHAVGMKAEVIQRALLRLKKPILFVDVDAWFHMPLIDEAVEEFRGYDYAAHWFQGPEFGNGGTNDNKMLSGTMMWRPNFACLSLLAAWRELNADKHFGRGQANLESVITDIPDLRVKILRGRWTRVFDKPQRYAKDEPIWIEHTIASRENRGGSCGEFDDGRQARKWELVAANQFDNVVCACRGEFGLKLAHHAPAVNAMAGRTLLFLEADEDILYPNIEHKVIVSSPKDNQRQGLRDLDKAVEKSLCAVAEGGWEFANFIITSDKMAAKPVRLPEVPVTASYDVAICPRFRTYGPEKNWQHWKELADKLVAAGLSVGAVGRKDTSVETGMPNTFSDSDPLKASIGVLQHARVIVATDNGLAHLAVMCGAKVLMIVEGANLVAPGYWPVRKERFAGRGGELQLLPHTWSNVDAIVVAVLAELAMKSGV